MDCAQARTYIDCYVDGELDPVISARIEQHLRDCAACQRAREQLNSLRSLIREGAPYHTAPDWLSKQIRARVNRGQSTVPGRTAAPWWRWLQPAALVAATAVVTWIAASQLNQPSQNDLIAGEIIASHARATLTGHSIDVATSDGHTVKPWLSSKLDFSPPVIDLSAAGFPLAGGRLGYIDNRPVSVLVYRRRQHVIDLFIWPQNEAHDILAPRALSKHGYHVLHWSNGGMMFWAISDLNVVELKTFFEKFSSPK
jgi:anti-sigma factor RsiW